MPVQQAQPTPAPLWQTVRLPGVSQPLLLEGVALLTIFDEGVCKGHLRLGNRLSGTVEVKSGGLGRQRWENFV